MEFQATSETRTVPENRWADYSVVEDEIITAQDVIVQIIRDCGGMDEDGKSCSGCVFRHICEPGAHVEDYFRFSEAKPKKVRRNPRT